MKQPPLITPREVDVPRAQRHTLPNGASLYAIPSDDFEVLRFTFVFRAGSSMQHAPFAASATANMLSEGSRDMTARQIAERLDFHGSYFEVNVDRDYVYISFSSLSKFFGPTLEVAEQILLQPLFPEDELRAYCEKRKQTLTIERRKVDTVVREIFAEALFGDKHPYGISYPEKDYDTLTRADLESLYRRLYTAENCLVVCSGRIGEEELQGIGALAEKLPRADRSATADFPAPRSEAYRFVERPDAVQSSLRVGRLLFTRTHPDFVGMQVVATVLGGYFGSRLMQNLRGEHGYTYGVGAAMVNFEREGYLGIAAQVGAEVTAPALREIYNEIERLRRGADARRGTFAGEEHHDGRGDAHPRRTVRHRRRDDRKPPLRHEQRCHRREHPPDTGNHPGRGTTAGRQIPPPRRSYHGRRGSGRSIHKIIIWILPQTHPLRLKKSERIIIYLLFTHPF